MARFIRDGEKGTRPGLYLVLEGEPVVFNYHSQPETEHTMIKDIVGKLLKTADGYYLAVKTKGGTK